MKYMGLLPQFSTSALLSTLALLVAVYFIYVKFIKTYREYSSFCKLIPLKYKTYIDPYYFFIPSFLARIKADYQKHGDTLYTYKKRNAQVSLLMIGCNIAMVINQSGLLKEFFEKSAQGYYKKTRKHPYMSAIRFIMGNGLVFSEGNDWKMKRKIMSTIFNYDFIKSKIPIISKIAKEVLDQVEKTQEKNGKNEVKMDLNHTLQEIFGNIVIKCFFGDIKLSQIQGKSVFAFFDQMFQLNNKRSLTTFAMLVGPKFIDLNLRSVDKQVTNMNKQFTAYAQNVINEQIKTLTMKNQSKVQKQPQQFQRCGLIQMLINESKLKNAKEAEAKPSDQGLDYYTPATLVDQFKTFFLAGTETTANNTTVLLYLLSKHKDIQERVRKQIDTVIGDDIDNISLDKLRQLKELQKCQKEALRMFNPVPELIMRQAMRDHYLGDIPIRKGLMVTISLFGRHYVQKFYEDPFVFKPDRWDTIDPKKADYYSFLPFSLGQRSCIGQQLAYIQGKIAVVHILKRYKQIKLQKPEFRFYLKTSYGAQNMKTTFVK